MADPTPDSAYVLAAVAIVALNTALIYQGVVAPPSELPRWLLAVVLDVAGACVVYLRWLWDHRKDGA